MQELELVYSLSLTRFKKNPEVCLMKTLTIEVEEPTAQMWQMLPPAAQRVLTSNVLNAILNGELYPTGTDQLKLAIELAEAGVSPEIISKLTRLDMDLFEPFVKK